MLHIFVISTIIHFYIAAIEAANILAIFPFTAKSHFIMFRVLIEELHSRGHNLTVISHFPRDSSTDNYKDISLVGITTSLNANMSLSNLKQFGLIENLRLLNNQIDDYIPIFNAQPVRDLLSSNSSFDLILTEIFNTDMFLVFAHKFKCPFIGLSASPLMPWAYKRIGLTITPSSTPLIFSDRPYFMSIKEIVMNTIEWSVALFYYKYVMNSKSEKIVKQYFDDTPSLEELTYQTSLIMVNTHFSLHSYGTSSKRLIEVGGMHIKQTQPLESSLEHFLNNSDNGVIIFSMGSMFRAESMPKEVFTIFLNVFSRLEQRVLWKWESGQTLKVKNIKFMKWLPQRDVLAHRNIKLFIYHGGLLGVSEAIYCGVPILGLPQFGDMAHNLAAVGDAGISLPLFSLTEDLLTNTIVQLINNPKHKDAATRLSTMYRDRPIDPLKKAVYWAEYTIRYNGTKHMRQPDSENIEIILTCSFTVLCLSITILCLLIVINYFKKSDIQKIKVM